MATIIEGIRTFLATYSSLATGAPLFVDHLGSEPTQYAIVPLNGDRAIETYINGGSLREYPFALQSVEYTADDTRRISNNSFYEAFSDWLDTQTAAGVLPTLSSKKTATAIEAVSSGYLLDQGESSTAIYQITCKLTYEQQP